MSPEYCSNYLEHSEHASNGTKDTGDRTGWLFFVQGSEACHVLPETFRLNGIHVGVDRTADKASIVIQTGRILNSQTTSHADVWHHFDVSGTGLRMHCHGKKKYARINDQGFHLCTQRCVPRSRDGREEDSPDEELPNRLE